MTLNDSDKNAIRELASDAAERATWRTLRQTISWVGFSTIATIVGSIVYVFFVLPDIATERGLARAAGMIESQRQVTMEAVATGLLSVGNAEAAAAAAKTTAEAVEEPLVKRKAWRKQTNGCRESLVSRSQVSRGQIQPKR